MIGFPPFYSEKIDLNVSRQTAREAVEYTLGLLGLSFSLLNTDTFLLTTPISGSSWGEIIRISLAEPGSLYIESKCYGFQVIDWGKNKKNVSDFLALFDANAIRNAKLLNEISENFERDTESRVDRFLDENKEPELEKRGNE